MKRIILLTVLAICVHLLSFGQTEKEINSTIKKVTVFTKGAQIENEATLTLVQGEMILKFIGLSPYINEESIRIDGNESFTILNVQHQNDFINELEKDKETESLKEKIEDLQFKIEDEETWIKIVNEKLDFLAVNKEISGKEQTINPETFKSLNDYYSINIEALNLDKLKRQRLINEYKKEINKINSQLTFLSCSSDLPSGTIIVTIDAKKTKTTKLSFNYLVENAGWYPTYDIRYIGIDKPLSVTYKANVRQNTGVDWKDANLVFSTAKTNISAQIPEFTPFYLEFYYPEIAWALQGRAAGVQISENSGVPGTDSEIKIRGISSINNYNQPSYIVDGIAQSDLSSLNSNDIANIEVLKDASESAIFGSGRTNGTILITTKHNTDKTTKPIAVNKKIETSYEYAVDVPQTILSNNKTTSVVYRVANLEANYEYKSYPKLSENVFLIGKISDWYKNELIDGEVNVYLENSFVGKSNISTQQFKDTLDISFGTDNNISIKRERVTEYSQDKFIGSNRKETIGYKLTIRNNKSYLVTTKIIDQVPVSTTNDIQVETIEISGGVLDKESGKVEWEVALNPNETRDIVVKYSVKYPKDKKVIVE